MQAGTLLEEDWSAGKNNAQQNKKPMLPLTAFPPVLQISRDGHVGSAIAATDAAFRLLRKAKQRAGPDSALFEVEPRGGDKD